MTEPSQQQGNAEDQQVGRLFDADSSAFRSPIDDARIDRLRTISRKPRFDPFMESTCPG